MKVIELLELSAHTYTNVAAAASKAGLKAITGADRKGDAEVGSPKSQIARGVKHIKAAALARKKAKDHTDESK